MTEVHAPEAGVDCTLMAELVEQGYRQATEAVDKAMGFATEHRKTRKRDYRKLWIARISAACKLNGMNYSRFIQGLTKSNIALNRKMLSEIAICDPEGFTSIVDKAKSAL